MKRSLSDCIRGIAVLEARGLPEVEIAGLAYDSRRVGPGSLFFALSGLHENGHRFVDAAIRAGAVAVLHSEPLAAYRDDVAYLRVADARLAMSPVADAFHGSPSRELVVVGVTGTEGKSTTVYLVYQLLSLLGRRTGFFSTVMSDTGGGETPNPEHQTTPEAIAVMRMLDQMRSGGCEYAIVESSSHGLSERLGRLSDVAFDVGVMTNVTLEHLEFHGTVERYCADKANLFRALDRTGHDKRVSGSPRSVPSFGVANADDPHFGVFVEATEKRVFSFSTKGRDADLRARDIATDQRGCSFVVEERASDGGYAALAARIELPGAFNVANVLATLLVVSRLESVAIGELLPLLPRLLPVRGRMTAVRKGQPFEVIVDYAHTPSSFEAILPPLRERTAGRIISLFGSGGERDTEKRPLQGAIAARYSDIVILADEDPRGEDSTALLEMIAAGCPELPRNDRLYLIPDRPTAIRKAFALAKEGDIVLLLGKGHENSIMYKDRTDPYDEIAEAEKALSEAGYE